MKGKYFLLVSVTVLTAGVLLSGCEFQPPADVDVDQIGYRGVGMEQVHFRKTDVAKQAANTVPAAQPAVVGGGPLAKDVYQNVQVLTTLTIGEFNRLMAAITEWVSPEEGCNYCHEGQNLASDAVYTKVVARQMLQMTRYINKEWKADHVADTGVTCYTCHRGQAVPEYGWYIDNGPTMPKGAIASRDGQNAARYKSVAYTSLPFDPYTPYLLGDRDLRVVPSTALPEGTNPTLTKDVEWTWALMMHVSDGLGVNCSFCHNSRQFSSWEQSPPQRVTAWHAIRHVRSANNDYINPLTDVLPDYRKGEQGDPQKINCATCHQGVNKPLYGVSMVKDYPSLKQ